MSTTSKRRKRRPDEFCCFAMTSHGKSSLKYLRDLFLRHGTEGSNGARSAALKRKVDDWIKHGMGNGREEHDRPEKEKEKK